MTQRKKNNLEEEPTTATSKLKKKQNRQTERTANVMKIPVLAMRRSVTRRKGRQTTVIQNQVSSRPVLFAKLHLQYLK